MWERPAEAVVPALLLRYIGRRRTPKRGRKRHEDAAMDDSAMTTVPAPKYKIKGTEPIAMGTDVQVRRLTLAPGEVIPWHFHSEVSDWYICLKGRLSVETRAPRNLAVLEPGGTYSIPPKTAHFIANRGDEDCQFALVQGVGRNDFILVGQPGSSSSAA
jgi:quercetin dioxygenase-like cupin family protein